MMGMCLLCTEGIKAKTSTLARIGELNISKKDYLLSFLTLLVFLNRREPNNINDKLKQFINAWTEIELPQLPRQIN